MRRAQQRAGGRWAQAQASPANAAHAPEGGPACVVDATTGELRTLLEALNEPTLGFFVKFRAR